MRKAVSVALATTIVASGLALGVASSASATVSVPDGKECTAHEYNRIQRGDSKKRVDRIVGSNGILSYGDEDSSGYTYGGVPHEDIVTAGCRISFKQAHGHKTVVAKDGRFGRA
jgi:hypothetical protein